MIGAILRRSVAIFDASAGLRLNGAMGYGVRSQVYVVVGEFSNYSGTRLFSYCWNAWWNEKPLRRRCVLVYLIYSPIDDKEINSFITD